MRKTTLLYSMLLMSLTAIAQTAEFTRATHLGEQELSTSVVTRAELPETILTAPDGRKVNYQKSGYYFYMYYGMQMLNKLDGFACHVIFGQDEEGNDNGKVYIYDPIAGFTLRSYIEGTRQGDEVVFEFPQCVYYQDHNNVTGYFYINMMEKYAYEDNGTPYVGYRVNEQNNRMVLSIDENNVLSMPKSDYSDVAYPSAIYGFTSADGTWTGYGDFDVVWTPFLPSIITLPEGVEPEEWALTSISGSRFVNVAFDGNDCYVGNLHDSCPDAYIKGTKSGPGYKFPAGTFLGEDQFIYVYMMPCEQYTYINDEQSLVISYNVMDEAAFSFDADKKTLSCNQSISISTRTDRISYIAMYDEPTIKWQDPSVEPGRPATPQLGLQYAYTDEYGYGSFWIQIPTYDVNNNLLKTENMFYHLYLDDEPFVLYEDEYPHLGVSEMWDIPYNFSDGNDIFVNNVRHQFIYYFTGVNKIGCISCYRHGDTVLESDMGWFDFQGSGVAESFDSANVEHTEWFDLQGRRIMAPAKGGIYIKREHLSDGTQRTEKALMN